MSLPPEKRRVLDATVDGLRSVPGLVAIVLGGSHARGLARASSDLDVGLYYRESAPLAVDAVRAVAECLAAPGSPPVVTDLYGWGAWVNGGAWIQTPAGKVDFVYRNLDQVRTVIDEGSRGVWRHDFDQQPPYGFRSVVYFGETHYCMPLHDPAGEIADLKRTVAEYPAALRETIVRDGLWGAEFSLWACEGFVAPADVYNASGCLTRAAQYLIHALFALNGEYFLNDKHVARIVAGFGRRPGDCVERLAAALAQAGDVRGSLDAMRALWLDTVALTEGAYAPRFDMSVATTHQTTVLNDQN